MGGISDAIARILFGLAVFAVLAAAILTRPAKWLNDFDQVFYITIAYDLRHHGVFTNGHVLRGVGNWEVNSRVAAPPPGMFFAPLYPWLVVAATEIDPRFARAADCIVEADQGAHSDTECELYARPVHLIHALLLALGVLAIAAAGEAVFARRGVFWLGGVLATAALLTEADLFSFVMTESLTFFLYGVAALALVRALKAPRPGRVALAGALLALVCLARTSFAVLLPVVAALILVNGVWLVRSGWRPAARLGLVFVLAWLATVSPWLIRNAVSVGRFGLTEEYGAATLVERLAFDDMSAREFALAFPYCVPVIGAPLVDGAFGPDAMQRFVYDAPGSFFITGRTLRDQLVAAHGRLDPLILGLFLDELREKGWRYLLASVPLGWCGMWVGDLFALLMVPLFAWATVAAARAKPLFLLYAAPPLAMLALHAALANQFTRYNLVLIGPFSAGAAWVLLTLAAGLTQRGFFARRQAA